MPNMSFFENRLSVKSKNSGDPSGLDGGGASPGPAPLNPISPPEASCSIHPIEVAPEAGLDPPATGAKPFRAVATPLVLVLVHSRESCSAGVAKSINHTRTQPRFSNCQLVPGSRTH